MKTTPLALIALTAGIACANPAFAPEHSEVVTDDPSRHQNSVTYDLSGFQFNDAQGSVNNELLTTNFAPFILVTGVSWDVNLTTIGASWASEATMFFHTDFRPSSDFNLNVADDSAPVSNQHYQSDTIDLTDNGLSNIGFFPGLWELDIEFSDSFVDNAGTGDAFFEEGSVLRFAVFEMPAPGPLAILGFGGLTATRRHRR